MSTIPATDAPRYGEGGIIPPGPVPEIIGHEQVLTPNGRIECRPVLRWTEPLHRMRP